MKTMSDILFFFETAFQLLNENYFDSQLPATVVTVQSSPKSYGHASVRKIWSGTNDEYYEINMSADYLYRNTEDIIATLLHEMIHVYCRVFLISEVSRNGTYHNKNFKYECEKRDLVVEKMAQHGWAKTDPSASLLSFIQETKLDVIFPFHRKTKTSGVATQQKKQSSRKYVCPNCSTIIRATSDVSVICGECGIYFLKEIES